MMSRYNGFGIKTSSKICSMLIRREEDVSRRRRIKMRVGIKNE